MLLNHHLWTFVYLYVCLWLCMETHRLLPVFWCFGWLRTCSGWVTIKSDVDAQLFFTLTIALPRFSKAWMAWLQWTGAFPPANDSTQVRLKAAEHSHWTLSRWETVMKVDVAQRKRNIAWVSKRIKLVPEREWTGTHKLKGKVEFSKSFFQLNLFPQVFNQTCHFCYCKVSRGNCLENRQEFLKRHFTGDWTKPSVCLCLSQINFNQSDKRAIRARIRARLLQSQFVQ